MAFKVLAITAALVAINANASPVRRQISGTSSGPAATGTATGNATTALSRVTPTPTVVSLWQQSRESAFRVGTAYLPMPSGSVAAGANATTVVYYYTDAITVTDLSVSTRVATIPVTIGEVDIYSGNRLIEGNYALSEGYYVKDCSINGTVAICSNGRVAGSTGSTSYVFTQTLEGSVGPLSANRVAVPTPITNAAGVASLAAAEGIILNGGDGALESFYANSLTSAAASVSTGDAATASAASATATTTATT